MPAAADADLEPSLLRVRQRRRHVGGAAAARDQRRTMVYLAVEDRPRLVVPLLAG
jgi:hypothetical protein